MTGPVELTRGVGALRWDVEWYPDDAYRVSICCDQGHYGYLEAPSIDADGLVQPMASCPSGECGWQALIRLVGWPGRMALDG